MERKFLLNTFLWFQTTMKCEVDILTEKTTVTLEAKPCVKVYLWQRYVKQIQSDQRAKQRLTYTFLHQRPHFFNQIGGTTHVCLSVYQSGKERSERHKQSPFWKEGKKNDTWLLFPAMINKWWHIGMLVWIRGM